MSACIFFASDAPLPEVFPPPEYGYLAINVDDVRSATAARTTTYALRTYPRQFPSIPTKTFVRLPRLGRTIPRAARGS